MVLMCEYLTPKDLPYHNGRRDIKLPRVDSNHQEVTLDYRFAHMQLSKPTEYQIA